MYILPHLRGAISHVSVASTQCVMLIEAALPEGSETAEQHAQRSLAGSPRRLAATTAYASPKWLCANATFCGSTALRKLGCWPFATTTHLTVLPYVLTLYSLRFGAVFARTTTTLPFPLLFGVAALLLRGWRKRRYSSRVPNANACTAGF